MRRVAFLLALSAVEGLLPAGCSDSPPPQAEVTLGGSALRTLLFFSGQDRLRAPEICRVLPEGQAAIIAYASERHIHLYGNDLVDDFDVAFLDARRKIVETATLRRDDVLPVPPHGYSSPVGVTSTKPAQYALLLRSGWPAKHNVKIGDEVSFSESLARRRPEALPVLAIDGRKVTVELADDDVLRARGLMHRTHLSRDEGMLFCYPSAAPRQFWMRHTLFSLDLAFVAADGTILNVVETPRWDDPASGDGPRPASTGDAQYVLEVNMGWFRKSGLLNEGGKVKPGLKIEIPKEARGR